MVSMKLLSLLCLTSATFVFAVRDEANRNILHFSNSVGWQGPPAALFNKDNTLRLYYEQPVDTDKVTGSAHMKWDQASTKDGLTWKDEDYFVKQEKGSSCKGVGSYYQGGMIDWKFTTIATGKFALVGQTCDGKPSIRNRFTTDGISSSGSSKGGLLIENKVAADGFVFNGGTYLALLGPKSCLIEFEKITGKTYPNGGQNRIAHDKAGSFSTGLATGSCRGVQIHPLDAKRWIVALSHSQDNLATQTKYWYGTFTGTSTLKFNPEASNGVSGPYVLDNGHDAQDFKFSTLNGTTVAIGWNGNQLYQDSYPQTGWKNSVTIPRYINAPLNGRLIQDPISFASKGIKTGINFGKKAITLGTKSCSQKVDLSKIEASKPGAFIFNLEFSHPTSFKKAGVLIEFKTKSSQILSVSFNQDSIELVEKMKLSVDRSKTDTTWNPKKNNIASAEVGGLVSTSTVPITIILDKATIEVFGLGGRLALTESYFLENKESFTTMCISSVTDKKNVKLTTKSSYGKYSSIWTKTTPTPSSASSVSLSFLAVFVSALFIFA